MFLIHQNVPHLSETFLRYVVVSEVKIFWSYEVRKVGHSAQIQPKSQFLFHKNLPNPTSPRDFSIMTLSELYVIRVVKFQVAGKDTFYHRDSKSRDKARWGKEPIKERFLWLLFIRSMIGKQLETTLKMKNILFLMVLCAMAQHIYSQQCSKGKKLYL